MSLDIFPNEILYCIFLRIPFEKRNWLNVLLCNKKFYSILLQVKRILCKPLEIGCLVFDPSIQNNKAIRWASQNGKHEVIKKLLEDPRVDPTIGYSKLIKFNLDRIQFCNKMVIIQWSFRVC